jgi:hypothetical protein
LEHFNWKEFWLRIIVLLLLLLLLLLLSFLSSGPLLLYTSSSGVKPYIWEDTASTLSFSLKFILDPNFVPLFWELLVSEFLLGVFAILLCSVSAPPVRIVLRKMCIGCQCCLQGWSCVRI